MAEITITETLSVTERDVTEEERHLSHKYNRLVDRCLDWAMIQMQFGLPQTQLVICRSVIASAARLAALENKTQVDTQRVAFQALLSEMHVQHAIEPPSIDEAVIDQDEEGGTEAV